MIRFLVVSTDIIRPKMKIEVDKEGRFPEGMIPQSFHPTKIVLEILAEMYKQSPFPTRLQGSHWVRREGELMDYGIAFAYDHDGEDYVALAKPQTAANL